MSRVTVHIVTGIERAQASALIARCIAERPDWAGLELLSCPCCTGRVELQVKLARLLRERRPARVLVGMVKPSHQPELARVLSSWPLAQHVVQGRAVRLPEDATLVPGALEER
jgi:hypothetical protein